MSKIAITKLQWSAIEVTSDQFGPMRDFAANILGLNKVYEVTDFAVFAAPNGSLLEIYGPQSKDVEWKNGKNGISFGFDTEDMDETEAALKAAGTELLGPIRIEKGVGVEGSDYRWRLFRGPDGRIYAVAQSDGRVK